MQVLCTPLIQPFRQGTSMSSSNQGQMTQATSIPVAAGKYSPTLGAQPVKGILKRPATQALDERAPRLKWDEENLIITEAQKDSTMKIDEPKTPFVHYDHELDKIIDMEESFSLDGSKKKHAALAHTPPVPSYMQGLQGEDADEEDEDEQGEDEPNEWEDSDEEEDQEETHPKVDHDKFARLRAEHYKMKEALKLGHELAEEELQAMDSPRPASTPGSSGGPPVPPLPKFAQQSNASNATGSSKAHDDGLETMEL